MLWDIIRDWFVQYIWGGVASNGEVYGGTIGQISTIGEHTNNDVIHATEIKLPIGTIVDDNFGNLVGFGYLSLGDWLSTISTIATLILLIVMLMALVRFVVRQISGLTARI